MNNGSPDIAPGRRTKEQIAQSFGDLHPPLTTHQAAIEAERCYFCYDAPCTQACPTGIDVPNFIRMISTGNLKGAGKVILQENILGGSCARVCPVESLCEDACVRHTAEDKPVAIGQLQRHAVDPLLFSGEQVFTRAAETGRTVAVVGAGPAGLACAHRLALHGHKVSIFDANPKAGGLNEYGIAAYKMVNEFAQREVSYLMGAGGIEIKHELSLGQGIELSDLLKEYDAIFLGLGLAGTRDLQLESQNSQLGGVCDAVEFIAHLRQSSTLESLPMGRRVVVIGGGSTAIDAAMQSKRLGAEEVTLVYRRGIEDMSATVKEQHLAQCDGVNIRYWAKPRRLLAHEASLKGTPQAGHIAAVEFEHTRTNAAGALEGTGEFFTLSADLVYKAIGQVFVPQGLARKAENSAGIVIRDGKIEVDAHFATGLPRVFAGGDCINGGGLTVEAVEHGKRAAEAIHAQFLAEK